MLNTQTTIAVVGLGYVGLPLAVEFGKRFPTIGFDLSQPKVDAYRALRRSDRRGVGRGRCRGVDAPAVDHRCRGAARRRLHHRRGAHAGRRRRTSRTSGRCCRRERGGRPAPEARRDRRLRIDGLSGRDRRDLRAGDRAALGHAVEARLLRRLLAGAHQSGRSRAHAHEDHQGRRRATRRKRWSASPRCTAASSPPACTARARIKVAEAAKVIENTQRDLNIALMNELAIIFHQIGIDTLEVLEAAGTKWNFLPFRPGPGRRPLHRRRSLLPHAQGRDARLPPAGDPRRAAASTTAWASTSPSRPSSSMIAGAACRCKGAERHRARPHVQGELPRPAQLPRRSTSSASCSRSAPPCTCTIRSPTRTRREHEYGVRAHGVGRPAARRRDRRRRRAPRASRAARWTSSSPSSVPRGLYVDVKCQADAEALRARGITRLEAVMATASTQPQACVRRRARRSPARQAAPLAGDRQRGLHRLASVEALLRLGQDVVGLDNFATGHRRNLDEVRRAVGDDAWRRHTFHRGRHRRSSTPAGAACARRRRRAAPGGAGLGAALDRGSAAHACRQRHRLPQHAGRRARRRRRALRLRRVELDLRRPPRSCPRSRTRSGVRCRRTPSRSSSTSSMPMSSAAATGWSRRPALLQRVRPAAGSGRRLRGGDPAWIDCDARRRRRS